MNSFPTQKAHRPARRRLGRGQYPTPPGITALITSDANTATLAFSAPVFAKSTLALNVAGATQLTQTTIDALTITLAYTTPLAGRTWTFAPTERTIASQSGAPVLGATGTFPAGPTTTILISATQRQPPNQGEYDLTWNLPITWDGIGSQLRDLLAWSPALSQWVITNYIANVAPSIIRVNTGDGSPTDITTFVVTRQLQHLVAPQPFATAAPTTPI